MSVKASIAAQMSMDDFYQNYSDGTSFFLLDDFLQRVGIVAADYYRNEWKRQYDEARAERREEIVAFEPTTLSEQIVPVKKDNQTGEWVGEIEKVAMSLPWDGQTSTYANVFDAKTGEELERSNINETWQYQYQPYNNIKFFRIDGTKIKVFTKGKCNLQSVRILYVPSIKIGDGDAELPDGIVEYVVTNTVGYMRGMADKKIIKKSLDGQQNMAFETEANKESLK